MSDANKERTANKDCIGKSFDEYIQYETKNKSKLATEIYERWGDLNSQYTSFHLRLRYYDDCFDDLGSQKDNIQKLWSELLLVYNDKSTFDMRYDLLDLARLTVEAGIDQYTREILDQQIMDFSFKKFRLSLLDTEYYDKTLYEIVDWFYFRVDYYAVLRIGSTETELNFLQQVVKKNEREFARIKSELPQLYLSFAACARWYYRHLPKRLDYNYDAFFRRILLGEISVYRDMGELEKMSDSIYIYKKETTKHKRFLSWFLDFFAGYGEKPFRLIKLYFLLQLLFIILFLTPFFPLDGISATDSLIKRLIGIIYFNNTTFLTIGYGDIRPILECSRIAVIIEQIAGFIVAGSFVTLSLRKIFRF